MPLSSFFSPVSIAVIGASSDPQKVGHTVLKNILENGFLGQVFPINPKGGEILSTAVFKNISECPVPPELAVIAIPSSGVQQSVEECGRSGVKNLVIISAGFRELGAEGLAAEKVLLATAQQFGMRILGPNCLGFISSPFSLNASFAAHSPTPGPIALLSQSGALGTALLDMSLSNPLLGLSHFVSLGNKADLTESDFLEFFETDPETKVVLSYCEAITDPAAFLVAASQLTQIKPMVVLKSGTSEGGQQAISSHTGSLAGSDAAYTAAFAKAGVLRAESMEELCDLGIAFAHLPPLKDRRLAVVTNAGGPGILATDALENSGLSLAKLSDETQQLLHEVLPKAASVHNPVDLLGDASAERYLHSLELVIRDPGVDAVLILLTPQSLTQITETAAHIKAISETCQKPIVASFMGGEVIDPGVVLLAKAGIPVYAFPERAIGCLSRVYQYFASRTSRKVLTEKDVAHLEQTPSATPTTKLDTLSANSLALSYGLRVPAAEIATSGEEAVQAAEKMGYPVVLKLESPDIIHKTEFKAVELHLESAEAVTTAFDKLMTTAHEHAPDTHILGCLVQQQIPSGGVELIAGFRRDATFGPLITCGLGGVWVEALKDVGVRLAPLSESEVLELLSDFKAHALLEGYRGTHPADYPELVATLSGLSRLSIDHPEIMECDINPLIVTSSEVWAADVRVMMVGK
jgi:acetyl coenzyme A synthetase (ADP forming)-like protein